MIREHHLRVERTARYATIGEPGPEVRELWVACHGYGQLAPRFARHLVPLAGETRLVAVPEALNRFYLDQPADVASAAERRVGATWMTREDRLADIDDYVRYLDALVGHLRGELGTRPLGVHALGFSQGAATAARWAALGRTRVDRLVLWAGTLPPDLDLAAARERLAATRLTLVAGDRDELAAAEQAREHEARLRAAGIPFEVLRFEGGHHLDAETLRRLAG